MSVRPHANAPVLTWEQATLAGQPMAIVPLTILKDIIAAEVQIIPNPLHVVIAGWILGVA